MASLKSFIHKVQEKNKQYQQKQSEKKAKSKGFSSAKSYEFYSNLARREGEESARTRLRKNELKRIRKEAEEETMSGNTGKYSKVQKKVQKGFESFENGTKMYNEMIGGLQSLGSANDSLYPKRNSNQAYASGYGYFDRPKTRRKSKARPRQNPLKRKSKARPRQNPLKRKSKARPRQNSFWSQFADY